MMRATGIETKRELFNNALTLFAWAIKQVQEGKTIASIDNSAENPMIRELATPALDHARVRKNK